MVWLKWCDRTCRPSVYSAEVATAASIRLKLNSSILIYQWGDLVCVIASLFSIFYIHFSAAIALLELILYFFHCCSRKAAVLASVTLTSRWLTPSDVCQVAGWQISFSVELIITFIHPLHLNDGLRCAENEMVPSSTFAMIPQTLLLDYMSPAQIGPTQLLFLLFCFMPERSSSITLL